MKKLHMCYATVKLMAENRLALLFVLALALVFPAFFAMQGVKAASTAKSVAQVKMPATATQMPLNRLQNNEQQTAIGAIFNKIKLKDDLWNINTLSSISYIPALIRPVPVKNSGDAFTSFNTVSCKPKSCSTETLTCPDGWIVTWVDNGCCAKCCQGANNCGAKECCFH